MPRFIKKTEKKESVPSPVRSRKSKKIVRQLPYIISAVVIVAALVLVGIAYYQQYYAPYQTVVITIDGVPTIRMRYFVDRARLAGSGGLSTIQNLTNEEILKLSEKKYGIAVTSKDIDDYLRIQASGSENETISDVEYNEWYRQLLNEKRVTSGFYRGLIAAVLRDIQFRKYVTSTIPDAVDHAHVYAIFTATYDDALKVKERADAGEDFGKLARELSIDEATREQGGELDWIPKGVYIYNNDPFMWEVGKPAEVLAVVEGAATEPMAYYVLLVKEIAQRQVADRYISEFQNRTYEKWLVDETKTHEVKWKYNSKIDAWLNWQLTKLNSAANQTSGG